MSRHQSAEKNHEKSTATKSLKQFGKSSNFCGWRQQIRITSTKKLRAD